jgi:uncharacterized tellurite resistance protein B-like protein
MLNIRDDQYWISGAKMTNSQDSVNCIKNLIQMMCCDGKLDRQEKKFLAAAAKQMSFDVEAFGGWNQLIKQVHKDGANLYPIKDEQKAISTLKGLVVMAKADRQIDKREKILIQNFAKSIGIGNSEFSNLVKDIDAEKLFECFNEPAKNIGTIVALEDEFEKLDNFIAVAGENGATVKTTTVEALLSSELATGAIVCFHASKDKEKTLQHCQSLLQKAGDDLVCVLTRFQGLQVKYLHELGLRKCVIEPIYSRDITDMFKK